MLRLTQCSTFFGNGVLVCHGAVLDRGVMVHQIHSSVQSSVLGFETITKTGNKHSWEQFETNGNVSADV